MFNAEREAGSCWVVSTRTGTAACLPTSADGVSASWAKWGVFRPSINGAPSCLSHFSEIYAAPELSAPAVPTWVLRSLCLPAVWAGSPGGGVNEITNQA